jgi:hypothetical protein
VKKAMKKVMLIASVLTVCVFVLSSAALATTMVLQDNTQVLEGKPNSSDTGSWKDVIGDSNVFDIFRIEITESGSNLDFDLYTNFDSDGYYQIGSAHTYLADLKIVSGGSAYGVVLKDHGDWLQGQAPSSGDLDVGLYSSTGWDTSSHFFESESGVLWYGEKWSDSPPSPAYDPQVAIKSYTGVKKALESGPTFSNISGDDPNYKWSFSIAQNAIGYNGSMEIFWGGTTCSNDAIHGTVPEAGIMWLLGSGLLGLSLVGRKKREA